MPHIKKNKWIILTVSLILLLALSVGIAASYIITGTSPIENIFDPARISCSVESDDGLTKSNVYVKNTGNVPIYVRTVIIVNWQSSASNDEIHAGIRQHLFQGSIGIKTVLHGNLLPLFLDIVNTQKIYGIAGEGMLHVEAAAHAAVPDNNEILFHDKAFLSR